MQKVQRADTPSRLGAVKYWQPGARFTISMSPCWLTPHRTIGVPSLVCRVIQAGSGSKRTAKPSSPSRTMRKPSSVLPFTTQDEALLPLTRTKVPSSVTNR